MENRSIAIDGPAGAGKSTLARSIAAKLGYVDDVIEPAMTRQLLISALEMLLSFTIPC